jgi:hypothetical protein
MRTLRQLFAAVVLVITVTLPTIAGDITTMGAPPPSSPIAGDMTTDVAGEITTMNADAEAGDSVADAALALIESVLSMF